MRDKKEARSEPEAESEHEQKVILRREKAGGPVADSGKDDPEPNRLARPNSRAVLLFVERTVEKEQRSQYH